MGYTTDFLLLVTDDDGDLLADGSNVDLGLAGATLCDLVDRADVVLDKKGRVEVSGTGPTGSAVLDEARRRFAERQGKKIDGTLTKVAKGLRDAVYEELRTEGAVTREDFKTLGVFSRHRWPVQDQRRAQGLRRDVLRAIEEPDGLTAHVAGLVALVSATGSVKGVTRGLDTELSVHTLQTRARAIADGDLAGAAVGKAIRDAQAAVTAAILAGATAAAASASVT